MNLGQPQEFEPFQYIRFAGIGGIGFANRRKGQSPFNGGGTAASRQKCDAKKIRDRGVFDIRKGTGFCIVGLEESARVRTILTQ